MTSRQRSREKPPPDLSSEAEVFHKGLTTIIENCLPVFKKQSTQEDTIIVFQRLPKDKIDDALALIVQWTNLDKSTLKTILQRNAVRFEMCLSVDEIQAFILNTPDGFIQLGDLRYNYKLITPLRKIIKISGFDPNKMTEEELKTFTESNWGKASKVFSIPKHNFYIAIYSNDDKPKEDLFNIIIEIMAGRTILAAPFRPIIEPKYIRHTGNIKDTFNQFTKAKENNFIRDPQPRRRKTIHQQQSDPSHQPIQINEGSFPSLGSTSRQHQHWTRVGSTSSSSSSSSSTSSRTIPSISGASFFSSHSFSHPSTQEEQRILLEAERQRQQLLREQEEIEKQIQEEQKKQLMEHHLHNFSEYWVGISDAARLEDPSFPKISPTILNRSFNIRLQEPNFTFEEIVKQILWEIKQDFLKIELSDDSSEEEADDDDEEEEEEEEEEKEEGEDESMGGKSNSPSSIVDQASQGNIRLDPNPSLGSSTTNLTHISGSNASSLQILGGSPFSFPTN